MIRKRKVTPQPIPRIDPATGIWSLEQAKVHYFDPALAESIFGLWPTPPGSTADLGCGKGDYCAYLAAKGWPMVVGYEGTPGIAKIANYAKINEMDLSVQQTIPAYQFAMSLEVAEHVPPEREQAFVSNVVRASMQELLISWAVDGQSGVGHVNCRDNYYVIDLLATYGFKLSKTITSLLRSKSTLPWFKNTLMWFYR
jgi:hypothetical protein